MNHLLRDLAPITDAGWEEIEEEARHADVLMVTGPVTKDRKSVV